MWGDMWRAQIDVLGCLGAFGNTGTDAGRPQCLSARHGQAFDARPPEPGTKRPHGGAAPRRGIWERELLAGSQDSFPLRVQLMDAHGSQPCEKPR